VVKSFLLWDVTDNRPYIPEDITLRTNVLIHVEFSINIEFVPINRTF
jgi:hypothetical protein